MARSRSKKATQEVVAQEVVAEEAAVPVEEAAVPVEEAAVPVEEAAVPVEEAAVAEVVTVLGVDVDNRHYRLTPAEVAAVEEAAVAKVASKIDAATNRAIADLQKYGVDFDPDKVRAKVWEEARGLREKVAVACMERAAKDRDAGKPLSKEDANFDERLQGIAKDLAKNLEKVDWTPLPSLDLDQVRAGLAFLQTFTTYVRRERKQQVDRLNAVFGRGNMFSVELENASDSLVLHLETVFNNIAGRCLAPQEARETVLVTRLMKSSGTPDEVEESEG